MQKIQKKLENLTGEHLVIFFAPISFIFSLWAFINTFVLENI